MPVWFRVVGSVIVFLAIVLVTAVWTRRSRVASRGNDRGLLARLGIVWLYTMLVPLLFVGALALLASVGGIETGDAFTATAFAVLTGVVLGRSYGSSDDVS